MRGNLNFEFFVCLRVGLEMGCLCIYSFGWKDEFLEGVNSFFEILRVCFSDWKYCGFVNLRL